MTCKHGCFKLQPGIVLQSGFSAVAGGQCECETEMCEHSKFHAFIMSRSKLMSLQASVVCDVWMLHLHMASMQAVHSRLVVSVHLDDVFSGAILCQCHVPVHT